MYFQPNQPMPLLTISCFGPFQAMLDGERLAAFARVKAQALFTYLALEAERPHHRDHLATLLWPADLESSARNSLRQTLYELRKLLGDRDDLDVPFFLITRQTVQFNLASNATLDVIDFLALIQAGNLEQAAALYRGELLSGLSCESEPFEEWLRQQRAYFHNLAVDVCFKLTGQALHQGDFSEARMYAQRQLALEPWREEAHRQLMLALALSGERSAALAQYDTCRRVLAVELSVEPDAETSTLYEHIKAGKLRGHRVDSVPSSRVEEKRVVQRAELQKVRHNLTPQPTAFIGRQTDLAQITTRLNDPACRLLTIVGPGGMGKTRLALQTAQTILDFGFGVLDSGATAEVNPNTNIRLQKFEDGIFFVALAGVSAPDLLISTVAATLKFSFYGSGDPKHQLLEHLRPKSMLLVLDNFEHLLDGADLMIELLATAPSVKVITTSREPLNLHEEWLHPLTGMSYPGDDVDARRGSSTELNDYTAVQLFIQCAQRMKPGFDLVSEAAAVRRICQLVDGMPLGIEMATSWLKHFSTEQITTEIERNLDFLATTLRNVPSRHRSMRAVFEHSWNLLSPAERQVLQRLAVFRGGFRLEAAQQIAEASFPLLLSLVEKSLVRSTPSGRYQLHELLRQFAEEKLLIEPQAAAETQQRHSRYYLTLLHQQEAHIKGREQQATIMIIETEIENIRTAWRWGVTHHSVAEIDAALESLYFFYILKCWFQEGDTLFGQAVTTFQMDEPAGKQGILLGRLLTRQGEMVMWFAWLVTGSADLERGTALNQQSLNLLNQLNAQGETALPLSGIAAWYRYLGRSDQAIQLYQQALHIYSEQGDRQEMGRVLRELGECITAQGNYQAAIKLFEQSIALCKQIGDLRNLGEVLHQLATVHVALDEYTTAKQVIQTTLATWVETDDQRGMAISLALAGEIAWLTGDYIDAQNYSQESLTLIQKLGLSRLKDRVLSNLGNIAYQLGEYQQARAYFSAILVENLAIDSLHYDRLIALALVGMASVLLKQGQLTQAAQTLYHVMRHPAAWQETKTRAVGLLAELATTLPAEQLNVAQEQVATQELTTFVARLFSNKY